MTKLAIEGGVPACTTPWPHWPVVDESDVDAVASVVRSGVWGSINGTEVQRFEEEFAAAHGIRYGIALNSGTTALEIALSSLGIGPGDEVIVPPYTFVATATAVALVGATPVFADIDPKTYNISPEAVEAAITPHTRAVIAVHFAGAVADVEALGEICERTGIPLIEDAAHAHGAVFDGKSPGAWGAMACFSFQSSKNLCSGEGGIILTNDESLAKACRSRVNCGRVEGGVWYEHHIAGGNYRLTEMQGALLRSQLRRLETQTEKRDANGRYLDEHLGRIAGIAPLYTDPRQTRHPRHLYMLRFDEAAFGMPRTEFIAALSAEGVPASPGYPVGLHHQPVFAKGSGSQSFPVTEKVCESEAIWLTQPLLLAETAAMDSIVNAIQKIGDHVKASREVLVEA